MSFLTQFSIPGAGKAPESELYSWPSRAIRTLLCSFFIPERGPELIPLRVSPPFFARAELLLCCWRNRPPLLLCFCSQPGQGRLTRSQGVCLAQAIKMVWIMWHLRNSLCGSHAGMETVDAFIGTELAWAPPVVSLPVTEYFCLKKSPPAPLLWHMQHNLPFSLPPH